MGDDIKSQVGATITHRVLTSLFRRRGVRLDGTMQLNVGGNSNFLNMLERERLEFEEDLEDDAVTSMLNYDLAPGTSFSVLPTMSPGSPIASGRTSAWRARPSATCR